ncbi:MAG: glycosyltransferase family 2 protein [Candidatus Theseobacter exili]|nr:glycosyltransferase family 2 protein [Candidatus Theseobacter exili]
MKLAVVILNWNNIKATIRCVDKVLAWSKLKPEILIVDNSSNNIEGADFQNYPSVNFIKSAENKGFAGGNNLAIKEILNTSTVEYVLLLNNDAEISEKCVSELINKLENYPGISIAGPVIREGNLLKAGGRNIAKHVYTGNFLSSCSVSNTEKTLCVDYVPGTAVMIRKSLFELIGLFDENYFFSGEMADLCKRAATAKKKSAVDMNLEATHNIDRYNQLRNTLYVYYNLRNRFLFVRKFCSWNKPFFLGWWIFCGTLMGLLSLLKGNIPKTRAVMLALADGIKGRFGNGNDKFI